jgi:hypothetical protein
MPFDSAVLCDQIQQTLRLRSGSTDVLANRESSRLEFKASFNLGSGAKYARTMSAFANNRGGYMVFGVAPSPHQLKGLNVANFEGCDPAKVTEVLNAHFSPELEWEMGTFEFAGVTLGFLYTFEATDKPVIATANSGQDVREGEIYYRYKGQSTAIRYAELRAIIEEKLVRERRAWMQHFQTISQAGPTNVGILDTIHGRLFGGGPPFLIDEALLRKLKFIRQGRFSDTDGEPTLRLIGDVTPVAGIERERPVSVGIHADDLFTAFLAQRQLEGSEARSYLRETSYQPTPYVPVHYFRRLSGLNVEEAVELVTSSSSVFTTTKRDLARRLRGGFVVSPIGAAATAGVDVAGLAPASLVAAVVVARTEKERRSILAAALSARPELVRQALPQLPAIRVVEAVTHLAPQALVTHRAQILELLLGIFTERFSSMVSNEKSFFRKAVTACDEALVTLGG